MSRTGLVFVLFAAAILTAPPVWAKDGKGAAGSGAAAGKKEKPKGKAAMQAPAKARPGQVTPEQQAQMDAIDAEARKTQEPLMTELGVRMRELEVLVKEDAPDEKLSRKVDQIDLLLDQVEKSRTRARARKDSLLTPLQRAKALLEMSRRKK